MNDQATPVQENLENTNIQPQSPTNEAQSAATPTAETAAPAAPSSWSGRRPPRKGTPVNW